MKKIIWMMTFVILLLSNVVQVTAAGQTEEIKNDRLISNKDYIIINNRIWFSETSCSNYDGDNIKWWSEGTKIYMQANVSEDLILMDEYGMATYYILRVKKDSSSDWKLAELNPFENGLMEASLDVSSYDDGQYFMGIYIDGDCLTDSVTFYIQDGNIYFGVMWGGVRISKYNEYEFFEEALSKKDPVKVLEEYNNSTMMMSYGAYEGGAMQIQALELTKGETSDLMKVRKIFEWLMKSDYENLDLFCYATAMFSSINIPCQLCLFDRYGGGTYEDYLIYINIDQQWIPIDFYGNCIEKFMPSLERLLDLSYNYENYMFYEYTPILDENSDENSLVELHIKGSFRYDIVEDVLEYVNIERKKAGVSELELDMDLTIGAMQRAIENTVYSNHTRPNGQSCYTVAANVYRENLAINNSLSAQTVVDQWMDSDGHRKNLLADDNKSIGIGCVEHNGYFYWVQLFSIQGPQTQFQNKGCVTEKATVYAKSSVIENCYLNGKTTRIPKQIKANNSCDGRLILSNCSDQNFKVILEASCLTYQFAEDQFYLDEETGELTAIGTGSSYITIAIDGVSFLEYVFVEIYSEDETPPAGGDKGGSSMDDNPPAGGINDPPDSNINNENIDDKQDTKPAMPPEQNVTDDSTEVQTKPTTEDTSNKKTADTPTKFNIKNKKTYKQSKKITIKDSDGIKSIELNNKKIKVTSGKKSFSFKLSKYKKYVKKKTKWNKLVVTDVKSRKKTIKFKVK